MEPPQENLLTEHQFHLLETAFHLGAEDASQAFAKWTGKPSSIRMESIKLIPLQETTGVLGREDAEICYCAVEMKGRITGQVILAFEDASGLALADLLLDQPVGSASQWGELEMSAALETTNILGCAFLNSLAKVLPAGAKDPEELLPSPPTFNQDFAESLIQFALIDQATASDQVLLATTQFQIDATPVDWVLLFVPDAESMSRFRNLLI